MKSAALVYQAGIANVFDTTRNRYGRSYIDTLPHICDEGTRNDRKRLLQADFRTCEAYANGLKAAGVKVQTFHCNRAGDILAADWSPDLDEAPFSDKFRPVNS